MSCEESFTISVPGKWILAGEHSVLRGYPAVAIPHTTYWLTLEYKFEPTASTLRFDPPILESLYQILRTNLAERIDENRPRGVLHMTSSIPLGAGFGSSAAICHGMAAWATKVFALPPEDMFETARCLEDHFHGKSSGLDIAVVSSRLPIFYRKGEQPIHLDLAVIPKFTFHDSGVRASTQDCISKVERFIGADPAGARKWDERMGNAAIATVNYLNMYSQQSDGRDEICKNLGTLMNEMQECFYAWGLVPNEVRALEEELRSRGAFGVKLTGAGGGGFVVALWSK